MSHTDTHDSQDTVVVTVDITLRVAAGQPDPGAARGWLADRIHDLTGLVVAWAPSAEEGVAPAQDYAVTAIAIRPAGTDK